MVTRAEELTTSSQSPTGSEAATAIASFSTSTRTSSEASPTARIQQLYRVIPDASPSLNPKLAATTVRRSVQKVAVTIDRDRPTHIEADFFRQINEIAAPGGGGGALWLGEHHNSANDHALQETLIRRIALNRQEQRTVGQVSSSPMSIGLEQVQVGYQPVLDAYIRGEVSIDEMRKGVEWDRRWVWPFEKYRPVFETARELGIPLVALNVDSEDMSAVERQGFAGLSRQTLDRYIPDPSGFAQFASERSFRAYVDYVIEPSYDLHQALGLLQHTMTGEALGKEMSFRDFLSGRLLWDEAMASRAYEWIQANPSGLLIGLVGADHVKFRSGIPGRFSRLAARSSSGARSAQQSVSILLNPNLIDTRPPGSVGGELAAGSDSPLFPDRLTLQLRYLKDGVDRDSADVYLPASTGGVLPLADYIIIGGGRRPGLRTPKDSMGISICGIVLPWDGKTAEDDMSQLSKLSNVSDSRNGIPYHDDDEVISPFLAYEDGYRWPDMYSEIDECVESSILVSALARLRKLARDPQSGLKNPAKVLSLPLSHRQVMDFVLKNQGKLSETKYSTPEFAEMLHLTQDRGMITQHAVQHRGRKSEEGVKWKPDVLNLRPSRILVLDDEFEEEELVFAVEVSYLCKRITVTFRGTETKKEWAIDAEIWMREVANPVAKHSTQSPTVLVHHGFYKYLFEPSARGRVKGPNGEALSQFQEILRLHVLPIVKQYPEYKLYVTGHSLGGALATLFGFAVAAEPDADVPKPVTVVSFGSPYVGGDSFRSAHQVLESTGRLRHVRVSAHKDLVPLVPKMAFKWNVLDTKAGVGVLFKHVGMNLRLYEGVTPFEIVYPAVRSRKWTSWYEEWSRGWDQTLWTNWTWRTADYFGRNHSLREYDKRLRANKPGLQSLQVNDCYARRDIVGYLVPQF